MDSQSTSIVTNLENVCSRFNENYFCTVKALEHNENELRVHFEVQGNMSLGKLQNPLMSRIYITEDSKGGFYPMFAKLETNDDKYKINGYFSYNIKRFKEGSRYFFSFGKSSYSRVPIFDYLGKGKISGIQG